MSGITIGIEAYMGRIANGPPSLRQRMSYDSIRIRLMTLHDLYSYFES